MGSPKLAFDLSACVPSRAFRGMTTHRRRRKTFDSGSQSLGFSLSASSDGLSSIDVAMRGAWSNSARVSFFFFPNTCCTRAGSFLLWCLSLSCLHVSPTSIAAAALFRKSPHPTLVFLLSPLTGGAYPHVRSSEHPVRAGPVAIDMLYFVPPSPL